MPELGKHWLAKDPPSLSCENVSKRRPKESYRCQCGLTYKYTGSLRSHQSTYCGQYRKRHVCHQCGMHTLSILQLPYAMSVDFKPYASATSQSQHQGDGKCSRKDGGATNVCFGCGKRYKWRDSLLRHQRVECGNKEKKFCCALCPKKFYHQYKLNEHYQGRHKLPKIR
ncbi:PREDICTED: zinc finger protein 79-like [Dufourea novaeangliae]|uniref:zinc finger protein 79-like n=1 Tax=Dufourea novaeangliae TaxID=178035 RepID=UPI000767655B|nr:PREDICTED: zinc finger protein 79-like [Dufourea novaeangliae]